ncbi:MAG: extracellular solute-binding protein [Ruminococcaceae bacterium]|nr:extracellular solute-binding protein [Oscillospiraceae bacterium]
MKKRISLLLAVLMAISVFALAACDSEGTKPTGGNAATGTQGTVAGTTSTEEAWPDRKMDDGAVLKVYGRSFASTDWVAEELTEEAINDAVYNRNLWLKDTFNFEVQATIEATDADWLTNARNAAKAGDGSYDLFVGGGTNMSVLAQENSLLDMASLENINLEADWWDQNATKDLSIANRVFFTSGALNTADIRGVYCIFMNKDVLNEKEDHEDPYQLAREKKWTMEKLLTMAKDYTADDGNGKWGTEDKYGYVAENYDSYALYFCSGERIVTKDADDLPVLAVETPRAAEFVGKMKEFYSDESVFINYSSVIVPISKDNRALFCGTILNAIDTYREMEGDYGILPLPMYEEGQESYSHSVSCATTGSLVGIAGCTNDPEATSFMVEMLCRSSVDTLKQAYMETTVKSRGLRDDDSYDMLDIIINSRVYDVAYMNSWGTQHNLGWMYYFYSIAGMPDNADQFASTIEKDKEATLQEIQDTIDAYEQYFD